MRNDATLPFMGKQDVNPRRHFGCMLNAFGYAGIGRESDQWA
jgi:hypothetical protein